MSGDERLPGFPDQLVLTVAGVVRHEHLQPGSILCPRSTMSQIQMTLPRSMHLNLNYFRSQNLEGQRSTQVASALLTPGSKFDMCYLVALHSSAT